MNTTVYISSKGRLDIYEDDVDIDRILAGIKNDGGTLSEFEFYEKQKPVYYGRKYSDGSYQPLTFPEPNQYGMGAPEHYSKAVTYRDAWKKFLQSLIRKKFSTSAEIKKIMVLALPITIMVFLIFVMVVALGG